MFVPYNLEQVTTMTAIRYLNRFLVSILANALFMLTLHLYKACYLRAATSTDHHVNYG